MIRSAAILLLALAFLPALQAGGKKPPPMQVSFHLEGGPMEGQKRVFPQMTAGKEVYFRIVPEITQKDIVAFRPFPADDEASYGVVFQLRPTAAKRLQSVCNANSGKFLLAVVNGQVRDAVLIDRAPNDLFLVIWQRIGSAEIRMADELMPRIGQDPREWKKNRKK